MRIIHEIDSPMQVSAAIHPHVNIPGMCGYSGIRVELLMCTSPHSNFPEDANIYSDKEEVIEIEGPLEMVLDTLKQAVRMLESSKKLTQEEAGLKRAMICPNCLPPQLEDRKREYASHTWECQAKWSEVAREQLEKHPDLRENQNRILRTAIEKLNEFHDKCGGQGCFGCKWTGKKKG